MEPGSAITGNAPVSVQQIATQPIETVNNVIGLVNLLNQLLGILGGLTG